MFLVQVWLPQVSVRLLELRKASTARQMFHSVLIKRSLNVSSRVYLYFSLIQHLVQTAVAKDGACFFFLRQFCSLVKRVFKTSVMLSEHLFCIHNDLFLVQLRFSHQISVTKCITHLYSHGKQRSSLIREGRLSSVVFC